MDFSKPIEIAPNIYWIGKYLEQDPFQCHPYFIDNGNESILIDPGSMLEFDAIVEKLTSLTHPRNIKYIVLHHQDPDLCASVPSLEKLIGRDDLLLVTHSRMTALIQHYMTRSPFYEIDKQDFHLKTQNGLALHFITTPYCHSPGAFVTYEPKTKVLFSSDIFGGVEESWQFYADENYFKSARNFHENYMPGKDIFNYALRKIEQLDLEIIAPQHGSIIKKPYIRQLIADMKQLDCGLYIDEKYNMELHDVIQALENSKRRLQQQENFLQQIIDGLADPVMVICENHEIRLMNAAARATINPKFIADPAHPKCYEVSHHRSTPCDGENDPCPLEMCIAQQRTVHVTHNHPTPEGNERFVELSARPLFDEEGKVYAIIESAHDITIHKKHQDHLSQQTQVLFHKANHDELTGLPTRAFLMDWLQHAIQQARKKKRLTAVLFIDLDNFKPINDRFGHAVGDRVLRAIARRMRNSLRESDLLARIGGDEFIVVTPSLRSYEQAARIAHKLAHTCAQPIELEKQRIKVSCSIGISLAPTHSERPEQLIHYADEAMYQSKSNGKNTYRFFSHSS